MLSTLVAATPGDYLCRLEGKFKTLRSLPFGHGIELGFFHGYKITGLTLENLNWQKWAPSVFSKKSLIIVHKVAFVSVKSCNSVVDVWGPPVFRNKLGKAGVAHRKLG